MRASSTVNANPHTLGSMTSETYINEERMAETKENKTTEELTETESPRRDKSYDPQVIEKKWQEKWEVRQLSEQQ